MFSSFRDSVPVLLLGLALPSLALAHMPQEVAAQAYRDLLDAEVSGERLDSAADRILADGARLPLLLDLIDSREFALRLPDEDAFIVATYRVILGRGPTTHEWLIARHFTVDEGVRSLLVAGLLETVDWTELGPVPSRSRDRIRLEYSDALIADSMDEARELARLSQKAISDRLRAEEARAAADMEPDDFLERPLPTTDPAGVEYNVYFGYLHAHSNVSFDAWRSGSEGPKEAYRFAREEGGLDWFGLSDHSEFISTFGWNNEWKLLQHRADAANEDGVFVALRGFEYSNPLYGHLVVFDTPDLVSAFDAPTLRMFYRWLRDHEGAVATFNHPGSYDDLGNEFYHFAYYSKIDPMVVGLERLQAGDTYSDNTIGYGGQVSYLDEAQRAGWLLGPVSAQDNHSNGWGITDNNRTGVLALELTRAGILDALAKRRFFASSDTDLEMSFQANGLEMGAVLPAGPVDLVLKARDLSESFTRVQIFKNGALVHDQAVSGPAVRVNLSFGAEASRVRYHAFVTQADGDQAMTSPIWVSAP